MKKNIPLSAVLTVVMAVVLMVAAVACQSSSSSSSYKYDSLEEYVQDSEVQAEASAATNTTAKCEIVSEGNALIVRYTYLIDLDEDVIPTLSERLKESMTESIEAKSMLQEMEKELRAYVNVTDPVVKMQYYTKDGRLLAEYEPDDEPIYVSSLNSSSTSDNSGNSNSDSSNSSIPESSN